MAGQTSTLHLLKYEFVQRADEGCIIPPSLRRRFEALDQEKDRWRTDLADPIYDELMTLPEDAQLAAAEPNELNEIRALRPDGPRDLNWTPGEAELFDRLHGAWTGRAAGCALGKPVEVRALQRGADERLCGRRLIREYLEARGDWPLVDFVSNRDCGTEAQFMLPVQSYRETIAYMEPDDDIHYTLMGLKALETCGRDVTWMQIGRTWLQHLSVTTLWTAEANAATNLISRSAMGKEGDATAAFCRRHRNPYREWIGAQIRADAYAYAAAGRPELAAELAWRDASWTHERNGIYGSMFFAAIIAAAFVERDFQELVRIGLSEIPHNCRLARWVRRCLGWLEEAPTWENAVERLEAELGDLHTVHTLNNALVVLIALYYGKGSLDETICIAVMCALDTDCNAATAGSIVGAMHGAANLGSKLAPRLNDSVKARAFDFSETTFTELARRHAAVWQELRKSEGK
ncbi:MAG: ADP-ribosylglycohydrolase family protein [Opitutales bacterium]